MTVERTYAGAWRITDLDADGHLVSRLYLGYTKREAKRLFRTEMRA